MEDRYSSAPLLASTGFPLTPVASPPPPAGSTGDPASDPDSFVATTLIGFLGDVVIAGIDVIGR